MLNLKGKKVLIILDSNAIVHRSYHALPDFRSPKGELVNAVYGFISILLKVLREFNPDYIAATFDVAGPTFRDLEYEEYKAKRVKAPDELYAQIPMIKDVLRAFNISIYEKESFEADDIIGTIAKAVQQGESKVRHPVQTIIVSGDLDTLQLVDKNTRVYTMRKGLKDTIIYDEEAVKKRFGGLTPDQMVDYKGLRGDPSDNIPGVVGIGEKTAIRLLSDFGSMDNLYRELEENTDKSKTIKQKMRDTLIKYKDQAFFSRELVTVRVDVPIDFKIENLLWKDYSRDEIERVFNKFNFRSLLGRLPERAAEITLSKSTTDQVEGAVDESGSEDPTYEKIEGLYRDNVFSKEIYELENNLEILYLRIIVAHTYN
ncbi:MAG: hypothetical protein IIC67_00970 [Thaumarchaeota archaeon]|nr:hypothetical protein [Nitrososphaerota archaeon]